LRCRFVGFEGAALTLAALAATLASTTGTAALSVPASAVRGAEERPASSDVTERRLQSTSSKRARRAIT
jgi:hypothetical protein